MVNKRESSEFGLLKFEAMGGAKAKAQLGLCAVCLVIACWERCLSSMCTHLQCTCVCIVSQIVWGGVGGHSINASNHSSREFD